MAELCDQSTGVIKPVTSQLPMVSGLESEASGNGHPGVAVTDVGRHVCTPEIRMPNSRAFSRVPVSLLVGRLAVGTPWCLAVSRRWPYTRLAGQR